MRMSLRMLTAPKTVAQIFMLTHVAGKVGFHRCSRGMHWRVTMIVAEMVMNMTSAPVNQIAIWIPLLVKRRFQSRRMEIFTAAIAHTYMTSAATRFLPKCPGSVRTIECRANPHITPMDMSIY